MNLAESYHLANWGLRKKLEKAGNETILESHLVQLGRKFPYFAMRHNVKSVVECRWKS